MKNNWSIYTETGGTHNLSKEVAEEKFNLIKTKGSTEAALYEGDNKVDETGYVETLL